jgi:RIO kinase 1
VRSHDHYYDDDDVRPGVYRGGRRVARRRARFDDEIEPGPRSRRPDRQVEIDGHDEPVPPEGERWSSWDGSEHGPTPHPPWLVTELSAVDTELGVLKSGKEADVHLVRRELPGSERS